MKREITVVQSAWNSHPRTPSLTHTHTHTHNLAKSAQTHIGLSSASIPPGGRMREGGGEGVPKVKVGARQNGASYCLICTPRGEERGGEGEEKGGECLVLLLKSLESIHLTCMLTHTQTHTHLHTHSYRHTATHTLLHTPRYTHTLTHTPLHTHSLGNPLLKEGARCPLVELCVCWCSCQPPSPQQLHMKHSRLLIV